MTKQYPPLPTLKKILEQQLEISKRLLELAELQTEAIVRGNVPRVQSNERAIRLCADRQTLLDFARKEAVRDVAFAAGLEQIPTISDLIPLLGTRDREQFERIRTQLLELGTQLAATNNRNRVLLENSLEFFKGKLERLTQTVLQPAKYGTNFAAVVTPTFYIDSKA